MSATIKAFKAPVVMVLAWVAACGTAVGHHFFNSYLNGRVVNDTRPPQRVVHGLGNGFATVVQIYLAMAIAAAYTQKFFLTTTDNAHQVKDIDTMFTARTSFYNFIKLSSKFFKLGSKKQPHLWFLAFLSWSFSTVTLIPPTTLVVELAPLPDQIRHLTTKSVDFSNIGLYAYHQNLLPPHAIFTEYDTYDGPQFALDSIVQRVVSSGKILEIPSPVPELNSSHVLTYLAPALQCKPASVSVVAELEQVLGCVPGGIQHNASSCDASSGQMPIYFSWTVASNSTPPSPTAPVASRISSYVNQSLTFYVGWASDEYHILNCSLWNTTYTTTLSYVNGTQSAKTVRGDLQPGPGSLPCHTINSPIQSFADQSGVNYIAMMDAIGNVLLGAVQTFQVTNGRYATSTTSALSSCLVWSTELSRVGDSYANYTSGSMATPPIRTIAVADAIEELFENVTVSLFSDARYRVANVATDVIVSRYDTIYIYTPRNLWVAYGAVCGITAIATLFALMSMASNKKVFSNEFSTILRTTRGQTIDDLVLSQDVSGKDPLSKQIEKASIMLGVDHKSVELAHSGPSAIGASSGHRLDVQTSRSPLLRN